MRVMKMKGTQTKKEEPDKNLVKTVIPGEQLDQNEYWKESLFKDVKNSFPLKVHVPSMVCLDSKRNKIQWMKESDWN